MNLSELLDIALAAVWEASRCCEAISEDLHLTDSQTKEDRSPVTIADYGSQALILNHLAKHCPDLAVVAEEDSSDLNEQPEMIERILQYTQPLNPELTADSLSSWLDWGSDLEPGSRFWTLDPIDGTKGYLRGGQYAVALSLIEHGKPVLGVLGCPRYEYDEQHRGVVFSGGQGLSARVHLNEQDQGRPIQVCDRLPVSESRLCESVESGHSAHDRSAMLVQLLGLSKEPLRMDSQAKYAAVAHGAAALYLRLPVKKGYQEKIWDHAAGVAVIEAAGGRVSDLEGKALDFSLGNTLAANRGVVASNGALHHAALAAWKQTE